MVFTASLQMAGISGPKPNDQGVIHSTSLASTTIVATTSQSAQGGFSATKKRRLRNKKKQSATAAALAIAAGTTPATPKRNRGEMKGDTPTDSTPTVKKLRAKQNPVLSATNDTAGNHSSEDASVSGRQNGEAQSGHGSFAETVKTACLNAWLISSSGDIREDNHNAIKNKLRQLILEEINNRGKPPVFDSFELLEGKVAIACADSNSRLWLQNNVTKLNGTIKDATFSVCDTLSLPKKPKLERLCVMFPSLRENAKDMLKLLHNQNVGLKTDGWRVYSKDRGNGGVRFTFGVDRGSIEWVKTHKMMLYYGTDRVKCTLPQKKMALKPSSSVATESAGGPEAMQLVPYKASDVNTEAEQPRTDGMGSPMVERLALGNQSTGQTDPALDAESICKDMAYSCHITGGTHMRMKHFSN